MTLTAHPPGIAAAHRATAVQQRSGHLRVPRPYALRPAAPCDAEAVSRFLGALSPESAFARFFSPLGKPSPALVRALVQTGPTRGAWLATVRSTAQHTGPQQVVGHASWATTGRTGEISVVVADEVQRTGLGRALVEQVLDDLRHTPVDRLAVDVLAANRVVIAMIGRRWPAARAVRDGTALTYLVQLDRSGTACCTTAQPTLA